MDFVIQHHSVRSCDFLDLIFAQIQLFGFCSSVRACGNSVNNLALRSSQRSVQSINILGGGNLINRTFKPLYRKYGLIHSVILRNGSKHFARFGNGNCTFLRHIGANYLNDRNAAFFGRAVLRYIKIDRLGVQNIAIRSLHFHD